MYKVLRRIIFPLVIAYSLVHSNVSCALPEDYVVGSDELRLDLDLPRPHVASYKGTEYLLYDSKEFARVLQIYTAYKFFIVVYPKLILQIRAYQDQIGIMASTIDRCDTSMTVARAHMDGLAGALDDQRTLVGGLTRRRLLYGVLIGAGGLVLGAAIGVLIGALAL